MKRHGLEVTLSDLKNIREFYDALNNENGDELGLVQGLDKLFEDYGKVGAESLIERFAKEKASGEYISSPTFVNNNISELIESIPTYQTFNTILMERDKFQELYEDLMKLDVNELVETVVLKRNMPIAF